MKKFQTIRRVLLRCTTCFAAAVLLLVVWPHSVLPSYASTINEDRQKLALIEEQRKNAASQRQSAAAEYQSALAAFKDAQSESTQNMKNSRRASVLDMRTALLPILRSF